MPTPHIAAAKGEIAERILLPGDPLRAKYIAENFLEGAKEYTNIRNILGYTGTYKGRAWGCPRSLSTSMSSSVSTAAGR